MAACETLSVPGTDAGLRRAADAFEAFAGDCGVPADVRWRFLVALDEALSNIVRYGYGQHTGEIDLTFSIADGVLGVSLSDTAPAFNPLREPPPDTTTPLSERQAGGLGIAMVHALMDEVQYERRDGRNHLVLIRRLPLLAG